MQTVSNDAVSGLLTGILSAFDGYSDLSASNLLGVVVGFLLFWPVGVFLLWWALTGRHWRSLPGVVSGWWASRACDPDMLTSGNDAFDAFLNARRAKIARLEESLTEDSERFAAFRADEKRRHDQAEFDRFRARWGAAPAASLTFGKSGSSARRSSRAG